MKINLILGSGDVRAGYANVDGITAADDRRYGSVTQLDNIVEDAESTEIVALDILDYLPPSEVDATLAHWARKLRRGGSLTVGGLDLHEVARQLHQGSISHDEANRLIYGTQDTPFLSRKSASTLSRVEAALVSLGLKIQSKSYSGVYFTTRAIRP